jgi:hypothetical protein
MSAPRLRTGETEAVPVWSTGVLLLVVEAVGSDLSERAYGTITEKRALVRWLENPPRSFRIYATWHGQYNTDLFVLDPSRLLVRLKTEAP